ncbi:hypothetical protein M7I_6287 [Glarea lozoyensis 74030]|uniref:Uncharacterized protein n=1 Tax=Glarea lozoyensis (strain ATCC 74030 / MF5533) TaxID=1104152 RepID=H0EU57_GLAL7|nr:hypothetical protein M7I_6287 [Glarea lozoyensis 74030]
MTDLLILKHDLGPVPRVSCDCAIKESANWILVAVHSINHQAVQKLVCCPDRLSLAYSQPRGLNSPGSYSDKSCPPRHI